LTARTGLTLHEADEHARRYLHAWSQFETGSATVADRARLDAAITDTLRWLWDKITAPVLDDLGYRKPPAGWPPRLWWCPTGILTLLPLHAAGSRDGTETVLDRAVSSYTPTARALRHAREVTVEAGSPTALVVSIPKTPGANALPGAAAERDMLRRLLGPGVSSELADADATRDQILTRLRHHRWLHAACHGHQDLARPTDGGLVPYDWATAGLVTVTDLVDSACPGGELAFLSACKTAIGGLRNLDEAVSVAAAMQYGRWRHVIATLWSVSDNAALAFAEIAYQRLIHDGVLNTTDTAVAVHYAVRALRHRYAAQPSLWVSFIHIGP
jgi:CHAT domain-containing protein